MGVRRFRGLSMRRAELAPRSKRHKSFCIEGLEQRMLLAVDLAIDVDTRFQQIDGFGTAVSGFPGQTDPTYQNMYFQDIGSSILRVPIDYRTLTLDHAIQPNTTQMSTPVPLGSDTYAN